MELKQDRNWLDSYVDYTEETESPRSFHFWTGVGCVAAALGRKVWIQFGEFQLFPNFYIVLVSPPGRCRKTVALRIGERLLQDCNAVNLASDNVTREQLIREIGKVQAQFEAPQENGTTSIQDHSSLTLISTEFSVFLGQKNFTLIALLCELFDCKDVWKYSTKNAGKDILKGVWFSLLAATTPEWMQSSMPVEAVGGGLTSRMLIVYEEKRVKRVTMPKFDAEKRAELLDHLRIVETYTGPVHFEDEAFVFFDEWYQALPNDAGEFGERKHIHVLKLAIIVAAGWGRREIHTADIKRAIEEINLIEVTMGAAFQGIGHNPYGSAITLVLQELNRRSEFKLSDLLKANWHNVSREALDEAVHTAQAIGACRIVPTDKGDTFIRRREQAST